MFLRFIKFLFIVFFIFCLASCAKTPHIKRYFFNNTVAKIPILKARTNKVLLVSVPVANVPYQTSDMLYVKKPYELSQFASHAWISPPAEMLTPLIVQSIQNTRHFYAVVSSPYIGLADLRLDTKLLALYQEFQGKKSKIVLNMQAELVDVPKGILLKSQSFSVCVDTPENTPYGGVVAANYAVQKILEEIAYFVSIYSRKKIEFLHN